MRKLSNITESVWGDIRKRSTGETMRKEDDINLLDFAEFFQYLKDNYEVCINDPNNFFEIGQWLTPGTYIGNISIPIEKNNREETPNLSNRMLVIQGDLRESYPNCSKMWIKPNKYVFRLYPNELRRIFGDKYNIDGANFEITPKEGEITNNICIDVLDKLLGMVEEPILRRI